MSQIQITSCHLLETTHLSNKINKIVTSRIYMSSLYTCTERDIFIALFQIILCTKKGEKTFTPIVIWIFKMRLVYVTFAFYFEIISSVKVWSFRFHFVSNRQVSLIFESINGTHEFSISSSRADSTQLESDCCKMIRLNLSPSNERHD